MITRYASCMLALLFAVPSVRTDDIASAAITSSSIVAVGCVIAGSIYAYKAKSDRDHVEQRVARLQHEIDAVADTYDSLVSTWQNVYQCTHDTRIATLAGAMPEASFADMRNAIAHRKAKLDDAYADVISLRDIDQYPSLQRHVEYELLPRYRWWHDHLNAVYTFVHDHASQLRAYDVLYRTDKLIYHYYYPQSSSQLVAQYTEAMIGWPRIKAVEQLQELQRMSDDVITHLCHERCNHNADAAMYDDYLINILYTVRDNIALACQHVSMSWEYDEERERYRHAEQRERHIQAEHERRQAEEAHTQAIDRQTREIERNRQTYERALDAYRKLEQRGYYQLPYVRSEIRRVIQDLSRYRDRCCNSPDIDRIIYRLRDANDRIPYDQEGCLEFTFNVIVS